MMIIFSSQVMKIVMRKRVQEEVKEMRVMMRAIEYSKKAKTKVDSDESDIDLPVVNVRCSKKLNSTNRGISL